MHISASSLTWNLLAQPTEIPIRFSKDIRQNLQAIPSFLRNAKGVTNFSSFESRLLNLYQIQDEEDVKKPADTDSIPSKIEPLPIVSYDSNTGFGFGAKAFFLNLLRLRESFDLIIFLSTKGQRWLKFTFSIPDFELRQGTVYPLSLDLLFDYDKWIAYNYFGVGNESKYEDNEIYTRDVRELNTTFSRGFSQSFVGQIALKYGRIESWGFDPEGELIHLSPGLNRPLVEYTSLYLNLRYDKRDSYIHPTQGVVIQTDFEWAPGKSTGNMPFMRWSVWFQYYTQILFPETILATRLGLKNINGDDLPLQMLIPLGGNRTLRGYSLGRFIDKTAGLLNIELRFPIYGRLGGLLGADAGRVWPSPEHLSIYNWHSNLVVGLRYYLDTYLVRIDFGISREILGIYFNFNHIF